MKKHLLLLVLLIPFSLLAQITCTGNFLIETDADLEAIEDCEFITGDLIFQNYNGNPNVILPNLQFLQGNLIVKPTGPGMSTLVSLSIGQLLFVGEEIRIQDNDMLEVLNLSSLINASGEEFNLNNNPALYAVDIPVEAVLIGTQPGTVNVLTNPNLQACCFAYPGKYNTLFVNINISGNAGNCEKATLENDVDNDDIPNICDPCPVDGGNTCINPGLFRNQRTGETSMNPQGLVNDAQDGDVIVIESFFAKQINLTLNSNKTITLKTPNGKMLRSKP